MFVSIYRKSPLKVYLIILFSIIFFLNPISRSGRQLFRNINFPLLVGTSIFSGFNSWPIRNEKKKKKGKKLGDLVDDPGG